MWTTPEVATARLGELLVDSDGSGLAQRLDRAGSVETSFHAALRTSSGSLAVRVTCARTATGGWTALTVRRERETADAAGEIARRLDLEHLIERLQTRFIHAVPDEMDAVLAWALEETGRFLDADRSHLLEFDPRAPHRDDGPRVDGGGDRTRARHLRGGLLAARHLCLEITETALMADPEQARLALEQLAGLGVELAIDDFGTGYSSLAYLKRFPVDILKIDQSFVRGLPHDLEDTAIVRTVIALAGALGMGVTAEGVEDRAQAAALSALGCRRGQGYLFSKAVPAAELAVMLDDALRVAGRPSSDRSAAAPRSSPPVVAAG